MVGPETGDGQKVVSLAPGGQAAEPRHRSRNAGLWPDDDFADDLAALHGPLTVGSLLER